jgi:hypothetical protein
MICIRADEDASTAEVMAAMAAVKTTPKMQATIQKYDDNDSRHEWRVMFMTSGCDSDGYGNYNGAAAAMPVAWHGS